MALQTFTWGCLSGPTGTKTYRVLTAQFGDGYKQVAADGINNVSQTWPLSFKSKTLQDIVDIRNFLDEKQGFKAFYWTPPLGVQGVYRCPSIGIMAEVGDDYTITATFEESFLP